jgi:mono/diheme cytochrome c family protein
VQPGNAANGATLYASMAIACNSCHGENAEGTLGPNITGSMTAGIGGWTEAQFYQVVRNGVARSGMKVCTEMVPFTAAMLPDQGIADIFAFVMSKSSDVAQRGTFISLDAKCATE